MNYQDRLHNVIPGGAHTYSRGDDQFPYNAPPILERAQGAYIFDKDGNKYLDYGMGLRAVTVGYSDEEINKAAIEQINNGNCLTRPSLIELKAAETIVELIDSADMVKFAKNGSNVTTAALKLSRAYTKKEKICVPSQQPFFSFDDWFISSTSIKNGTPQGIRNDTLKFEYGNIESLIKLFENNKNEIAAVMLEPATTEIPCNPCDRLSMNKFKFEGCKGCSKYKNSFWLRFVNYMIICALLIFDEMITGFRWHLKGAQHLFNVKPDLSTFGKGMANGFSLSALVGKKEIMELGGILQENMERTFLLSSTHGAEMSSLGAFVCTVSVYKKRLICDTIWSFGEKLLKQLNEEIEKKDLSNFVKIIGPAVAPAITFFDSFGKSSPELRTIFVESMMSKKIMMPWLAFSASHGDEEGKKTLLAFRYSLNQIKKAVSIGFDKVIKGPLLKPVFRKFK